MKYAFSLLMLLWFLSGCTRETPPLDEARMQQIRFMLDSAKCMDRMRDLEFEIIDRALADTAFAGGVPAGVPESLFVCPVSGEAYVCSVTTTRCYIRCPAGHGTVDERYL